jgi:putative hydrolase of the HAD superfamily
VTRALIFDLDDTLYRERRFALSGFAAVAAEVERRHGVPSREGFGILRAALTSGQRAGAFQRLAQRLGAGEGLVEECRTIYRQHRPRLRLSGSTRDALASIRPSWRLGLLTNGLPAVQRLKVEALGLEPLVDIVIYAHEVGDGKPDPRVFLTACARLGVTPGRAVMVGDDPWCDIDGARGAGLRAIRVRQGWHRSVEFGESGPADCTVRSVADVPGAARALIQEGRSHAD